MDYFSLKKSFEESTRLNYNNAINFERAWKPTKTYKGEGIVDPYGMAPFATLLLQESKVTNPSDALFLFYSFATSTTIKCTRPRRKGHYGPIVLSPEDYCDFYSMRTMIKGRGACNNIAAEILALCKSVGIPSFFKRRESHGYVDAWVSDPGWVHLGYSEGILCNPKSKLFSKFIRNMIEFILKKNDKNLERKIRERILKTSENMVKYGFCDQETIQERMNHLMTTITSDYQVSLKIELFEGVELFGVDLSHHST